MANVKSRRADWVAETEPTIAARLATLEVDVASGVQNLADVLTAGNDPGGQFIIAIDHAFQLQSLSSDESHVASVQAVAIGGVSAQATLQADATVVSALNDGLLVQIVSDVGSLGQALVSDGAGKTIWSGAAFVEPTTATPEAICNALIAAGLMAAS